MSWVRSFTAAAFWPIFVLVATTGTWFGISSDLDPAVVLLLLNIGVIGTLLVAERIAPFRRDWNAPEDPQILSDFGHAFTQGPIAEALGRGILLVAAGRLAIAMADAFGRPLWPTEWPLPAQILLVALIGDGLDYWKHRIMHTIPRLWPMHALHHGIVRLHALKSVRFHFTDQLLRWAMVYVPLVLIGATPEMLAWYTALIIIPGPLAHANIRLKIPPFLHRLVLTPPVHYLHHSIERNEADSNYANIFPLWDVLFGTFSDPRERPLGEVGVKDDPMPGSFLKQMVAPFIWGRLARSARRSERPA